MDADGESASVVRIGDGGRVQHHITGRLHPELDPSDQIEERTGELLGGEVTVEHAADGPLDQQITVPLGSDP